MTTSDNPGLETYSRDFENEVNEVDTATNVMANDIGDISAESDTFNESVINIPQLDGAGIVPAPRIAPYQLMALPPRIAPYPMMAPPPGIPRYPGINPPPG